MSSSSSNSSHPYITFPIAACPFRVRPLTKSSKLNRCSVLLLLCISGSCCHCCCCCIRISFSRSSSHHFCPREECEFYEKLDQIVSFLLQLLEYSTAPLFLFLFVVIISILAILLVQFTSYLSLCLSL